jgi:hypothetical protein
LRLGNGVAGIHKIEKADAFNNPPSVDIEAWNDALSQHRGVSDTLVGVHSVVDKSWSGDEYGMIKFTRCIGRHGPQIIHFQIGQFL